MSRPPHRASTPRTPPPIDERPAFTVGTRTYIGRHLAPDVRERHVVALLALERDGVPDAVALATIHAFVHALFADEPLTPALPAPPWWAFWRAAPPPPLTPFDLFTALPQQQQLALAVRWAIAEALREIDAQREHQLLQEARADAAAAASPADRAAQRPPPAAPQ